MRKLRIISLSIILASIFSIVACKKSDPIEVFPPEMDIIETDTTGTLGKLECEILYWSGTHEVSVAPSQTDVHLYASAEDYANFFALYETWTVSTNNVIDFGYLNPGNYYVWASTKIGYSTYEVVKTVQVVAGQVKEAEVIMDKVLTDK